MHAQRGGDRAHVLVVAAVRDPARVQVRPHIAHPQRVVVLAQAVERGVEQRGHVGAVEELVVGRILDTPVDLQVEARGKFVQAFDEAARIAVGDMEIERNPSPIRAIAESGLLAISPHSVTEV